MLNSKVGQLFWNEGKDTQTYQVQPWHMHCHAEISTGELVDEAMAGVHVLR